MASLAFLTRRTASSRTDLMNREPMVSRTVLMPIDLYRRVDTYAKSKEISWSAAVRRLTEAQLPVEEAFPFDGVPLD